MYGPPPAHPTLGTFHFGALENTEMSLTLAQILVGNSLTPGQILAGISPTAWTKRYIRIKSIQTKQNESPCVYRLPCTVLK